MSFVVVLAAAIASWLFGAAYYMALSRPWLEASGFSPERRAALESGKRDPLPFVLSFAAEVLMATVLALLIRGVGSLGVGPGLVMGATLWLGFVLTTIATNNAYGGRGVALTAIDAGHWLGVLIIQGAILGAFA